MKEEERLAATVADVDEEVAIAPRRAFVMTPQGHVVENRSFSGLSLSESVKLYNYLHLRDPQAGDKTGKPPGTRRDSTLLVAEHSKCSKILYCTRSVLYNVLCARHLTFTECACSNTRDGFVRAVARFPRAHRERPAAWQLGSAGGARLGSRARRESPVARLRVLPRAALAQIRRRVLRRRGEEQGPAFHAALNATRQRTRHLLCLLHFPLELSLEQFTHSLKTLFRPNVCTFIHSYYSIFCAKSHFRIRSFFRT